MYQAHKQMTGTRCERIRECHQLLPKTAGDRNLFRLDDDGVIVRSTSFFDGAEPLCPPKNGERVTVKVLYIPKRNGRRVGKEKHRRNSRLENNLDMWLNKAIGTIAAAVSIDIVSHHVVAHGKIWKGLGIAVDLTVIGRVSDQDSLEKMMASGIGDHRSYGCGMLVVDRC